MQVISTFGIISILAYSLAFTGCKKDQTETTAQEIHLRDNNSGPITASLNSKNWPVSYTICGTNSGNEQLASMSLLVLENGMIIQTLSVVDFPTQVGYRKVVTSRTSANASNPDNMLPRSIFALTVSDELHNIYVIPDSSTVKNYIRITNVDKANGTISGDLDVSLSRRDDELSTPAIHGFPDTVHIVAKGFKLKLRQY